MLPPNFPNIASIPRQTPTIQQEMPPPIRPHPHQQAPPVANVRPDNVAWHRLQIELEVAALPLADGGRTVLRLEYWSAGNTEPEIWNVQEHDLKDLVGDVIDFQMRRIREGGQLPPGNAFEAF